MSIVFSNYYMIKSGYGKEVIKTCEKREITNISPGRGIGNGLEIYTMQSDDSQVQRPTFHKEDDALPVFPKSTLYLSQPNTMSISKTFYSKESFLTIPALLQ